MTGSFVWRGVIAIALGIIAIAWPGITVGAVVILFAIAAFTSAFIQGARAFSSDRAGPVAGHLLLAVLDVAAGVVAIAWPGITAEALTIWIGIWAVVTGAIEFGVAFGSNETAGERALFGLGGLVSVALGIVLFAHPDVGAVSLAQVFGLFSLVYGISAFVEAAWVHRAGSGLESMISSAA